MSSIEKLIVGLGFTTYQDFNLIRNGLRPCRDSLHYFPSSRINIGLLSTFHLLYDCKLSESDIHDPYEKENKTKKIGSHKKLSRLSCKSKSIRISKTVCDPFGKQLSLSRRHSRMAWDHAPLKFYDGLWCDRLLLGPTPSKRVALLQPFHPIQEASGSLNLVIQSNPQISPKNILFVAGSNRIPFGEVMVRESMPESFLEVSHLARGSCDEYSSLSSVDNELHDCLVMQRKSRNLTFNSLEEVQSLENSKIKSYDNRKILSGNKEISSFTGNEVPMTCYIGLGNERNTLESFSPDEFYKITERINPLVSFLCAMWCYSPLHLLKCDPRELFTEYRNISKDWLKSMLPFRDAAILDAAYTSKSLHPRLNSETLMRLAAQVEKKILSS